MLELGHRQAFKILKYRVHFMKNRLKAIRQIAEHCRQISEESDAITTQSDTIKLTRRHNNIVITLNHIDFCLGLKRNSIQRTPHLLP